MPDCNAFHNHVCVDVAGNYKPCCRYGKRSNYNVREHSFLEFRNSDFYRSLTENMQGDGWDSGCTKCQKEEQAGVRNSMRQNLNNELQGAGGKIQFLELSVSNQCNITCRMCSPQFSSKWAEIKNVSVDKQDLKQIIGSVDLSELKRIKYLGGEPFITTEFSQLIDILEQQGVIENITIQVNTNATFFPSKYINKLKKLKMLHLVLSIDGIGEVDEYVRQGTDWKEKEQVIDQWIQVSKQNDNVRIMAHSVIQAYNIHDTHNIKEYVEQRDIFWIPAVLSYPPYLSLNALPSAYIEQVKNESNEKFLEQAVHDPELNRQLIEQTKSMDKTFNKHLSQVDKILKHSII